MMDWTANDTWIVVVGALAAVACGVPGCYLLLRRMSMMGDAISHAVLPGIAIAFILSGSRDSTTMFLGAMGAGVLTAVLTQLIHRFGRVETNASMGVVFTTLFAIGLVLMVRAAESVDIDPGCVLYGSIEFVPLDVVSFFGWQVPRAAMQLGVFVVLNIAFIAIFFKELNIATFDPALATSQGFHAQALQYVLLGLIAATTVAAFEAVGSILVVALILVPAATAALLTNRLIMMLIVGAVVGVIASALGRVLAITGPSMIGFEGMDMNSAGGVAIAAGIIFGCAAFLAPERGVIRQMANRLAIQLRILREDALGLLYRFEESNAAPEIRVFCERLQDALSTRRWRVRAAMAGLRRRGLITIDQGRFRMTSEGQERARSLVRSHRLWEAYLATHLAIAPDHVHGSAMQLEHITGADMRRELASAVGDPAQDPHGHEIPASRSKSAQSEPTEEDE